jgi:hypothetical protein
LILVGESVKSLYSYGFAQTFVRHEADEILADDVAKGVAKKKLLKNPE